MAEDSFCPVHCARLLSVLGAPERMRVISLLTGGPHTVNEIAHSADIALCNLSHHLTVLKEAEMVRGERQGRFVWYSLRPGMFRMADDRAPGHVLDLGCCQLVFPTNESKSETDT